MPELTAAEVFSALVRVAYIISPAHGAAAAHYAMEHIDSDPMSPDFIRLTQRMMTGIVAEFDIASTLVEKVGGTMMLMPIDENDALFAPMTEYRNYMTEEFAGLKMVDGLFIQYDKPEEFWPE